MIPKPNKELFKHGMSYSGVLIWNVLPDEINLSNNTIATFLKMDKILIKWIKYFLFFFSLYCIIIIGIKHDFLCINICWAPREVLKSEPERRGFQHLPRGPADVNVSEKHV